MSALSNSSAKRRRARTDNARTDNARANGADNYDSPPAADGFLPVLSIRESIILLHNRLNTIAQYITNNNSQSQTNSVTDARTSALQQSVDTLSSQVDTLNKSQSTFQLKQHLNESELLVLKERLGNMVILCEKLERRNTHLEKTVNDQADFISKMQGLVVYEENRHQGTQVSTTDTLDPDDSISATLDVNTILVENMSLEENVKIETLG